MYSSLDTILYAARLSVFLIFLYLVFLSTVPKPTNKGVLLLICTNWFALQITSMYVTNNFCIF